MNICKKCGSRNLFKITHGDCVPCWEKDNRTATRKTYNEIVSMAKERLGQEHIDKFNYYLNANNLQRSLEGVACDYAFDIGLGVFTNYAETSNDKNLKALGDLAELWGARTIERNIVYDAMKQFMEEQGVTE